MKKLLALLCSLIVPGGAVTKTVCASGCNYSDFQGALDAAVADCTIDALELKAGETFTSFGFRFNHRPCNSALTVRTSRWAELPSLGYRVIPGVHAALMPIVTINNTGNSVLQFDSLEMLITAASISGKTIDLSSDGSTISHVAVGTAISCTDRTNGLGPTTNPQPGIPAPLQRLTKYFVKSINSRTSVSLSGVQLSLTPGGAAIAISSTDGINSPSTSYYAQPQCALWENASNITLRGLDIRAPDPGPGNNYGPALVQIGVSANTPQSQVSNITIQQSLLRGDPTWRDRGAPRIALWMDGHNLTIQDSYLQALAFQDESKCFATTDGSGLLILNNECDSIGGFLLSGGAAGAVPQQPVRNVKVLNNFALAPGWMMYESGAGAPSGPCYFEGGTGAFYRNTAPSPNTCANGACYTCQGDSTWELDTGAVYRPSYFLPKARLELKNCRNCEVAGNIIRGNIAGNDTGNTGCMAVILTEQSLIDSNGIFYFDHENILFHHNWCDRVWSGILVGQAAPISGPAPYNILGLAVQDQNTFRITTAPNTFTNYTYPFYQGITASGNMGQLNGRWNYDTTVSSTVLVGNVGGCGAGGNCLTPDRFDASGTWISGGTVQGTRWRPSRTISARHNVITRIAQFPQLSIWPTANTALSRPFRFLDGHIGGPIALHNTVRMDVDGRPQFALVFENGAGHGTYPNGLLQDSILAGYTYPFYDSGLPSEDCTTASYGGWFANAGAFSRMLQYGPNALWPPGISACSSHLATASTDAAVGFAGTDQSVLVNTKLASSSAYSAANGSPTLLSSDGTDLGADVDALNMITSGVQAGTPPWDAALHFDLGSTKLIGTFQGTAPWTLKVYNSPARIAANQVASTADSCGACVVDGIRRQIVVPGLTASSVYYYSATDGARTLVGQLQTLASGSGAYSFNVSGSGVRYSSNSNMSSPTLASNGTVPVTSDSIRYVDHGPGTSVVAMVAR